MAGTIGATLVVAIALLQGDCGDGDSTVLDTGPLALYDGVPSGNDGDMHGILVREGECLFIDWAGDTVSAGFRILVVFAASATRWNEDDQAVEFDGHTLQVGTEVELGGGGIPLDIWEVEWVVPPDPTCDTDEGVWVAG
jgi:hypothetical protein